MQRIKSWNRYSRIYPHLHNQLQEVVAALLGPTNTQRTRQQLGNFPLFPKLSTQFLGLFCCCCVPKTSADPIPEKKNHIPIVFCSSYPRKCILSQKNQPTPEKISYLNCLVQYLSQKKKKSYLNCLLQFLSRKKYCIPAVLCSS